MKNLVESRCIDGFELNWYVNYYEDEEKPVHWLQIGNTGFIGHGYSYVEAFYSLIEIAKDFEDDEYLEEFPREKQIVDHLCLFSRSTAMEIDSTNSSIYNTFINDSGSTECIFL